MLLADRPEKTMIPKENYYSRAIFEEEMRSLFDRGFQLAALTTELEADGNFVTLSFAGTSLFAQNFGGEIKAFENRCCESAVTPLHRQERGNGAPTCLCHGWTFNEDGEAGDGDIVVRLGAYRVEICGIFVFVARSDSADLRAQLGSFYDTLIELSSHIGLETHYSNVPHQANWKLLVENVIECDHCSTVHQKTFIPYGFGKAPLDDLVIDGDHSSCHFPRLEAANEDFMRRSLSHLNGRTLSHRSYYHIYIFPGLLVSSSQGTSFYVGQLLPISPEATLLRVRYFEPKMDWKSWHRTRQDQVNVETVDVGLRLLQEDKIILENIQKVMRLSPRPGALSKEEVRIAAFAERYEKMMGTC
jgi:phenylpropionate dioxygenase-like ring-hydroxylating dioxygenase large terminal subunit